MWKFACEGKRVNDHNHTSNSYFISCTKLEVGQSKRTDGGEICCSVEANGLVWRDLCMISALLQVLSASTASQSNSPTLFHALIRYRKVAML